ncbi:MAG: hypothetical protein M3511_01200 [Deinococcota bacterium]|nr:hypothetical protein [Deinococcota bacterium]
MFQFNPADDRQAKLGRRFFFLLGLLFLSPAGLAQADIFSLAEVRPGQQGYGVTAGPGNVLERFSVEVLAVQEDLGPGFPLVLIRTGGDFIERSGGVAAGMSGSPIYLDERLLGALAYAFPNSDHRLALVTPIEAILRTDPSAASAPPEGLAAGVVHEGHALGPALPVRTPVLVSGLSGRASEGLERLFAGEVLPIQSGRMSAQQDEAYSLEPGSAISVQLVRGDITIAAVGTVTHIEDGRLWAFGHPLLERGAVSLALTPAYISHIVPSLSVPFKLANSGQRLLGSIVQDRPHGISGLLGQDPGFIPVSVTFSGPGGTLGKRFEVTADERFYAPLLFAASLQALDEILEQLDGGTVELAWEIVSAGETVRILEQTADVGDIAVATASLAASPLEVLATNAFSDPQVERVNLSISYEPAQRVAGIVRVVAENEELEAGDTLIAHVRLQPYRAESQVETVRVAIPEDAPEGLFDISFRGGMEPDPEGTAQGENAIMAFSELLSALEEQVQASELVVEAYINGDYRLLERVRLPFLVSGSESVLVTVLGPEGGEAAPAPEPFKEPGAEPEPPEPDPVPPSPLPLPHPSLGSYSFGSQP